MDCFPWLKPDVDSNSNTSPEFSWIVPKSVQTLITAGLILLFLFTSYPRSSFWDLVLKIKVEFFNGNVYSFHIFNKELLNVFYIWRTVLDTQMLRQPGIMGKHTLLTRSWFLAFSFVYCPSPSVRMLSTVWAAIHYLIHNYIPCVQNSV